MNESSAPPSERYGGKFFMYLLIFRSQAFPNYFFLLFGEHLNAPMNLLADHFTTAEEIGQLLGGN